jgi:hypothetical protein
VGYRTPRAASVPGAFFWFDGGQAMSLQDHIELAWMVFAVWTVAWGIRKIGDAI